VVGANRHHNLITQFSPYGRKELIMAVVYLKPSPKDTRIIVYQAGNILDEYAVETVTQNHEDAINRNWHTVVLGSRSFAYGVTTDEELSLWLSGVCGFPTTILSNISPFGAVG